MSVYSYESFLMNKAEKTSAKPTSKFQKVGYFKLSNDGDSTLVRFAYKDKSEFEIATVHVVEGYKRVVCLRDAKDPVTKCPLCEAGEKLYNKFYVKLIEYTKDENGNIVATPKIWERPAGFAQTLDSLCTEYGGALSDHIFKIKRRGAKGDTNTTYDVMYANPELYKESVGYVKDFSAFENFDLSRHSYYVKSFEEIAEYCETGKFPEVVKAVTSVEEGEAMPTREEISSVASTSVSTPKPTVGTNPYMESASFGFSSEPSAPISESVQTDPTFSRPRRTPQSDIYR